MFRVLGEQCHDLAGRRNGDLRAWNRGARGVGDPAGNGCGLAYSEANNERTVKRDVKQRSMKALLYAFAPSESCYSLH